MSGAWSIRPVTPADEHAWRSLWNGYNAFYEVAPPEAVTRSTWARILDVHHAVHALLAVNENGEALGFANYVLHPYTWSEQPACLLEDLFTAPQARGRGIGGALIQHLLDLGRARGWGRVYWHTREDNHVARRLYERFTPYDGFVRYAVNLGPRPSTAGGVGRE